MEARKMVACSFIEQGYPKQRVLRMAGVPRSSYYYQPKQGDNNRGIAKSTHTLRSDGKLISNEQVVKNIEQVLSEEFVDYGYLKVTHWLRQEKNYVINPKKVYRLMKENRLLNRFVPRKKGKRNWVKELLPPTKEAFDYLEFDIKYFYIAGKDRNALLLSVLDVQTRWLLGHFMNWDIKNTQVVKLFDQIFEVYPLPKSFYVRSDNGSQFIAQNVQSYFESKTVQQEFCKPATPEQNAHIESYHSIQEKLICQAYEFESIRQLQQTLNRFADFYNFDRIHSGIKYQSPYRHLLTWGIDMKNYQTQNAMDCTCNNLIFNSN